MTTDPFAGIVTQLQGAVVGESARMGRIPVIVAAQTLDILKGYWRNYPKEGVSFTPFDGRGDAIVQNGPCGAMLWMDPVVSGYRDTYGKFLRTHWGATRDLTNSGYDVDHVYNRARAKQYGYKFVRMFLVKADANRDHGRVYEKQIGTAEANRRVKIMKLLDGMSELKVLGLPAVKNGLLTPEHHAAAQLASVQYGIPLSMALDTLRDLCARANPD
jgi:hypothetical protein